MLKRACFFPLSRQPASPLQTPTLALLEHTRHPSQAGEGHSFLWLSSTDRGLDHTWTSSEGFELGLTLFPLKAREDFNTKRVEIHFWTTLPASKGEFNGAELALVLLVSGQHATGHFGSEQHLAVLAKKKWLIILG